MKLLDVYTQLLKENVLGIPVPTSAKQASRKDMEDALDHMSDFTSDDYENRQELNVQDFSIINKVVDIEEIESYDDLSSWAEWSFGELVDMDEEERKDTIDSFRGSSWARMADNWIKTGNWPTIVIVELKDGYTAIGDGRGRVSLAYGLGLEKLPVTFMKQKAE